MAKRYEIIQRSTKNLPELEVGGRKLTWYGGPHTRVAKQMTVRDAGLAKDIIDKYGQKGSNDIAYNEVYDSKAGDGHTRYFTVPEMPWKRKSAGEGATER